jgi:hypothetical protein
VRSKAAVALPTQCDGLREKCVLFLTRTPSGAVRTSGVVVGAEGDEAVERVAAQVADFATTITAAASGKIGVVIEGPYLPVVHVFQRRRDGTLQRAWCGNALAAASAFAASSCLKVVGPGRRELCVSVSPSSQVWSVPGSPPAPEPFVVADGTQIWSSHVLNDYMATEAPVRPPVPAGNGKTVVIDVRDGNPPLVVFGTADGQRAAAPLTGLVELRALAAVAPFASLDRAGAVRLTDDSVEPLPAFEVGLTKFSFDLPGRRAELTPLARTL